MLREEQQPATDIRIDISGLKSSHILLKTVYTVLKNEESVDLACEFLMEAASTRGNYELLTRLCREYVICE